MEGCKTRMAEIHGKGDPEMLSDVLHPSQLHGRLERELASAGPERPALPVTQLVPNTIRSFGDRLQAAFAQTGQRLGIDSTTFHPKDLDAVAQVVAQAENDANRFLIVQVQGREGEVRLLEPVIQRGLKNPLIVYIHRPEELILRISFERNRTYSEAKGDLAHMLKGAAAVILPGACFLGEYQEMLPQRTVVAIPLGFAPSHETVLPPSRLASGAVTVIGSNTTWGEMRDLRDLLNLLEAVRKAAPGEKVVGFAQGDHDARSKLGQYLGHEGVRFLSNAEIVAGRESKAFTNEEQFRDWLHRTAAGNLIIRGRVENGSPMPESLPKETKELYDWENRLIDFNVQMYREILDGRREPHRRGLPKVEYSGTLHKAGAHVIFVVFQSGAMDDVRRDEGLTMVEVPASKGQPDFDAAAARIVELIRRPGERNRIIDGNRVAGEALGMDEVTCAFFLLMDHLRKTR